LAIDERAWRVHDDTETVKLSIGSPGEIAIIVPFSLLRVSVWFSASA
jgi:hypothetical protein